MFFFFIVLFLMVGEGREWKHGKIYETTVPVKMDFVFEIFEHFIEVIYKYSKCSSYFYFI